MTSKTEITQHQLFKA